jgi:hypothetical protein
MALVFCSLNFYKNLVSIDATFMNRRWLSGGHAKWLPIPNIKPGTMPGAFDLVSIVIPIGQRSTIMSADVVDTEKLFADSKDQDNLIADLD